MNAGHAVEHLLARRAGQAGPGVGPGGLEAARAAGCATLAVTTTPAPADLIADAVVDTLADVRFAVVDGRVRLTAVVADA